MIGLSLSFCVRDIVEGKVAYDEVEKIIAGTCAPTPEVIDGVIDAYKKVYWRKNPEASERIARQLFADNKVEQPRVVGKAAPNIAEGYWQH